MDKWCVALLGLFFLMVYIDNQGNLEGFTLDGIASPVSGSGAGSTDKELVPKQGSGTRSKQPIVPAPKKVDMKAPASMSGSFATIQGAPLGGDFMLLSADMTPGIRTSDSNVPMAYPRSGGYGNLGKDSPEYAIGQKPTKVTGPGRGSPGQGSGTRGSGGQTKGQTKGSIKVTSVYAPWCGWSKKSLPDFQKTDQKLNSLSPEETGGFDISHELINSETPEGKQYIKDNDIKGFPTVHVEVNGQKKDGPREHAKVVKLLNDQGANIQS
jgi:hypothetical protein